MFRRYQFSSAAQPCLTLCGPTDCSTACRPPCPSPTPGAMQIFKRRHIWNRLLSEVIGKFSTLPPRTHLHELGQGQGKEKGAKGECCTQSLQSYLNLRPCGPYPARLICPRIPQARTLKEAAMPPAGDLPNQASNLGLLQGRQLLYHRAIWEAQKGNVGDHQKMVQQTLVP